MKKNLNKYSMMTKRLSQKKFESKCKKYRINYYKINQTIKKTSTKDVKQ